VERYVCPVAFLDPEEHCDVITEATNRLHTRSRHAGHFRDPILHVALGRRQRLPFAQFRRAQHIFLRHFSQTIEIDFADGRRFRRGYRNRRQQAEKTGSIKEPRQL
jgi:hypothetical protein